MKESKNLTLIMSQNIEYDDEFVSDQEEDGLDYLSSQKNNYYEKIIDLTDSNKEKIEFSICNFQNYKIDNFLIKIKKYAASLDSSSNLMMDVEIYEEIESVAYNSEQCKILQKIDVPNDLRFNNQHWYIYFNKYKIATRMPLEVLVEMLRWCQALIKMRAFL
jgi:hypothetical protein